MNFRLGRTWWVTIISVVVEALLAVLTAIGDVPAEDAAIPAAAVAAVAVSHNAARAWEDGKRNGNAKSPDPKSK